MEIRKKSKAIQDVKVNQGRPGRCTQKSKVKNDPLPKIVQQPLHRRSVNSISSKQSPADKFYPNAVDCLLALYNEKVKCIKSLPLEQIRNTNIWIEIEKEMQESYFDFKQDEIKAKLIELREQYFNIRTKKDIELFEYFHQLHEIYHDPIIQAVIKGDTLTAESQFYNDEVLLNPNNECEVFANIEIKSENMEAAGELCEEECDRLQIDDGALIIVEDDEPAEKFDAMDPKRLKIDEAIKKTVGKVNNHTKQQTRKESKESQQDLHNPETVSFPLPSQMTLEQFNEHKERRHQEKMALWQKSLQLQERAIEIQQQLLQQLVNRI